MQDFIHFILTKGWHILTYNFQFWEFQINFFTIIVLFFVLEWAVYFIKIFLFRSEE